VDRGCGCDRAARGWKQKHDRRAAALILKLMEEKRFPRIWVPTVAERDLRQLLIHRQHLVRMRTRIKNQLQHIALTKFMDDHLSSISN
jgi:transposase